MSVRVFNKKWTRRIEAENDPSDFMLLRAYAFEDVPERYTGDITFKLGVKAGDIEIIETRKQAEKVEAEAAGEEAEKPVPKAKASTKKGGAK